VSHIAVLAPHPYIIDIAQVYLNNYLMPRTLTGDALHLAYASYYKIDFLLTWNCQHLANANKKQHIRIIVCPNQRLAVAPFLELKKSKRSFRTREALYFQ
jgi:hypothetical protein